MAVGAATFTFDGTLGTADIVTAPVTGATIAKAPNVVTWQIYNASYSTIPAVQATIASGATSPANAITNNSYFEVVLTGTGTLTRIRFKGAKGGATSNRGFSVRSSDDAYASEILGVLNQATVRPNWTQYDQAVSIPFTSGQLTLRWYLHTPGTSSTQEFDDIILDVDSGSGSVSLSISDLSIGSPSIGVPVANYIRNLSISNFNVGSPSYGPVSWTQRHALVANGLSTSSPTLGPPTLGQRHALSIAAFAVGSPGIGTPSLSTAGTANFTINGLTTGSPTFGNVGIGQRHVFTIPSFSSGSPTTGTPALGQRHALTSSGLTVGSPDLGTPALSLAAIPVKSILAADAEERVLEPEMEIRRLSADVELRVLQYEEDI
jgi:hypothetical protein